MGARQLATRLLAALTTCCNQYCSGQLVAHTNALIFLNFLFLVQACFRLIVLAVCCLAATCHRPVFINYGTIYIDFVQSTKGQNDFNKFSARIKLAAPLHLRSEGKFGSMFNFVDIATFICQKHCISIRNFRGF